MKPKDRREDVVVDLVGELDVALAARLNARIAGLEPDRTAVVLIRLERVDSTQIAGLRELAEVLAAHRSRGIDVRVRSRLPRVRTVLEAFGLTADVPEGHVFFCRRRVIIARTPKPQVA